MPRFFTVCRRVVNLESYRVECHTPEEALAIVDEGDVTMSSDERQDVGECWVVDDDTGDTVLTTYPSRR